MSVSTWLNEPPYDMVAQIARDTEDEWFPVVSNPPVSSQTIHAYPQSYQFDRWPLREGPHKARMSNKSLAGKLRQVSPIHDLYSYEVYGEGGLVEQANYFTAIKTAQDSSSSKDPVSRLLRVAGNHEPSSQNGCFELFSRPETSIDAELLPSAKSFSSSVQPNPRYTTLVDSLASDTSGGSSMQQFLDSIQHQSRSGCPIETRQQRPTISSQFKGLISTLSEGAAELKVWKQLTNHLKVAIKRWRSRKTLFGLDAQISLSMAYAHSRRLRKAVFLASELIRSMPIESRSSNVIQLCAGLTRMCLESNEHDLVLEMWAANSEPFLMCLPGSLQHSKLPYGALRTALYAYCASIDDLESFVKRRYDKETNGVAQSPLRKRRLERIAQVLLTASTATNVEQAARFFHAFADLSVRIPPSVEASLWTRLTTAGDYAEAWRVFSESSLGGLMRGRLQHRNAHETLSRVVFLSQKCNNLQTARLAFRQILYDGFTPTVRDSELLLRTCADNGQANTLEEVVKEFFPDDLRLVKTASSESREMLTRGSRTSRNCRLAITRAFIRIHVLAQDVDATNYWWDRLKAQPGGPHIRDYNNVLQLYARKGDFDKCQLLLDDMSRSGIEPDAASFTSVMAAYASKRDYIAAGRTIADMQNRGIVVDSIAIGSIMNVAIETGNWQGVAKIHESLDESLRSDSAVAGTMMKALMLLGAPYDEIKKLFLQTFPDISRASQRAWSILIQSACDAGRIDEAHDFLVLSMRDNQPIWKPNSYAFTVLVAFYLRKGDIVNAKRVFSRMDESGVPLTSVAYSLVIRSLLKDNSVDTDSVHRFAEELLADRPWQRVDPRGRGGDTENIITPVMMEAARLGNVVQVEQYMQRLAEQDLIPSITVSTILMDAYRKARQLDKMRMVWKHIFRNACQMHQTRDQSGPSNILCIPLSIFLDGLTTACYHDEAFDTWRLVAENGFGFDAQNWNHLAVALMRSGQPERAFDVVENVLLEKAEQVKSRNLAFVREIASAKNEVSHWHEKETSSGTILKGDLQDEAAMRPPNRRHQYRRRLGNENPLHEPGDVIGRLLRSWRPADITWRPTFLTIAVLERAYTQLENGVPIMALLAGQEEEVEEGFLLAPQENSISSEADTGRSSSSPVVLLARLNRRYARTVSLILLHRRKRQSRQPRKSKKSQATQFGKAKASQEVDVAI